MKMFSINAKVNLTQKPSWLDDFRSKYDKPYEWHVTLKQACIILDDQVSIIKDKLDKLFSDIKTAPISLTVDKLDVSKIPDHICIMIKTTDNIEIGKLQKNILSVLSEYNKYHKEKYRAYEENFNPHITIARSLNEQSYEMAMKDLKEDYVCKGTINQVRLIVVDNTDDAYEVNDPANQTVYNL